MALVEAEHPAAAVPASSRTIGGCSRFARHRWGIAATALIFALFAADGVPTAAETVVLYVAVVVLADAVGTKGLDGAVGVAKDWLPVVGVLVGYKYSRGVADSLGMPVQMQSLVDAEKLLFAGTVPTVWLQERLIAPSASWWEGVTALVYLSHFFVSFIVLGVLHGRSRVLWAGYLKRFITLNVMGVATYILVPAAPPWMAAGQGLIGEVQRTTRRGIDVVGIDPAGSLLENGQQTTNHVAALPSLHAGYAFLVSLFLLHLLRRRAIAWIRVALVLYPLAMCFTLVYSGEHYVVDLLLGLVYALVTHRLWTALEARDTHDAVDSVAGRLADA